MKRVLAAVAACVLIVAGCGGNKAHPKNPKLGVPPPHAVLPLKSTGPSVLMWDAVTTDNIPTSASYAACYASGSYANCGAMRARLPHAVLITIATNAGVAARCLDIEPGDAVPSQAPGWVRWMVSLHVYHPCLYASLSNMSSVTYYMSQAGFSRASYKEWGKDWGQVGVARSSYEEWDANWTSRYGVDQGYDATQYLSNCCVDLSAVSLSFFSTKPGPPPPPPIDATSFNEGFNAGYATGMGKPYHTGYASDHTGKPSSASAYNLGFGPGVATGHAWGLYLGRAAESNTRAGFDFNTSYRQGFNTGFATGASRPYYTGFVATKLPHASDTGAYNKAWVVGKPKGFNALFAAGYGADK